ncbi:MAG: thiamine diphosphokinase [Paenisporosarcina sp.]
MKTVMICAGGPKAELVSFEHFRNMKEVVFIGADKGAIHLLQAGIIPDEAVGDFDSLSEEEYSLLTSKVTGVGPVSSEKDETDTDLAIVKALEYQPQQIYLTGVTGGRMDHFLAVVNSVYRFQSAPNNTVTFKILNKWNEIFILTPGVHSFKRNHHFPYISFFAIQGPVSQVSLIGMKYDVHNEMIEIGTSRFTSNELLSEDGSISFSSGICLVIRSSDE